MIWRGDRWLETTFTQVEPFARTIIVLGGLLAAGAYALMWNAGRPGFWAALSVAAAVLHGLLAYGALRHSLPDTSWGLISLGLAVPYLVAAERLARWRLSMAGATEALGFAAVGVAFFIAAATVVPGSEVVAGGTSGVAFGDGEGEHATSTNETASNLRMPRS